MPAAARHGRESSVSVSLGGEGLSSGPRVMDGSGGSGGSGGSAAGSIGLQPGPSLAPVVVPAKAVTVVATTSAQVHIVQRGESLSRIASLHGISLAQVLALNPQFAPNPNLIHPGDQVVVG